MRNTNYTNDSEPVGYSNPTYNQGRQSNFQNSQSNMQGRGSNPGVGTRAKEGSNSYTTISPKLRTEIINSPPVDTAAHNKPKKEKNRSKDKDFDLNDEALIKMINRESKKLLYKGQNVPVGDEEVGIEVKERVKMYSEEPIRASQRINHQSSSPRKSNLEGRKSYIGVTWKLEGRESYRGTQSGFQGDFRESTTPGYNNQFQTERPSVIAFKKQQTEAYEDEGELEYRDGFFCGVCTTRSKPAKTDESNQLKRKAAKFGGY